ncbi:venom acid phosphatase Acph-1-like [Athalia rosae]|uniref:venom acid phosphatase Acph-1-like n=1 Tax=Athalia rosae TaxID=37344 RepID=UPI002033C6F0|nr:venom acid phosphatase Acph-1-like [Athalia rosae]
MIRSLIIISLHFLTVINFYGILFVCRAENETVVLELVSVLFRHGDRTPVNTGVETYPEDPYLNSEFFPDGPGALINTGKKRQFEFGKALRSRYDEFLGPFYYPKMLEARSTDFDRTKMSLQLVLNGVFPPAPRQQWKDGADWQPIPTKYSREYEDFLRSDSCPKYLAETKRFANTPEMQAKLAEFNDLMKWLEIKTGKAFEDARSLHEIYTTLTTQNSMGLALPEWVNETILNRRLYDGDVLHYEILNGNVELRRLFGGALLRKIIDNGLKHRNGTLEKGKKLYLYSAHDTTMAGFMWTLGIWESRLPEFSSGVIIELLKKGVEYFVKVIYYQGIPSEFVEMQIPGCARLCPFEEFINLLKDVIATDEDLQCV